MKELLKGDPQSLLPRHVDARAIEKEMETVRLLMEPQAFWIISAATVESVALDAAAAFRQAFAEFRRGEGAKIVVLATNPLITETVRAQARQVRVDLTVVGEYKDAVALRREYDKTRPKKQKQT